MGNIGIALSGGSIKGAYQAGCLLALEERGLFDPCDLIVGTSVGAINAAALSYANPFDLVRVYSSLKKKSDIFKAIWWKFWELEGLYSLDPLKELLLDFLSKGEINRESIACYVNIDNLKVKYVSNKELDLENYIEAVLCSSAIPGFFSSPKPPRFDGGIKEGIPIDYALSKKKYVIAISTSNQKNYSDNFKVKYPPFLSYAWRAINDVMQHDIYINDTKEVNSKNVLFIQPEERIDVGITEINREKNKMMIDLGYEQVIKMDLGDFYL